MNQGRRADQARRPWFITAIQDAARSGDPVSVSAIARAASVDRSFLYRHPDLLAQLHAAQTAPTAGTPGAGAVSHAALQADLANALDRSHRLAGSGSWRPGCPSCSASKPGTPPGSAPRPTSTNSSAR